MSRVVYFNETHTQKRSLRRLRRRRRCSFIWHDIINKYNTRRIISSLDISTFIIIIIITHLHFM